jgi:hypothetical protein
VIEPFAPADEVSVNVSIVKPAATVADVPWVPVSWTLVEADPASVIVADPLVTVHPVKW